MSRLLKFLALLAFLVGAPSVACAAAAVDMVGTYSYSTLAGSNSNSSLTVSSTGANYALVVQLTITYTTASPISAIGVTWNSVGMTLIQSATVTGVGPGGVRTLYSSLWGLTAPASGNKTAAASWTGSAIESFLEPVSFTGVNQTGGTTSFPNAVSGSAASGNPSVSVTSKTGDIVIDDAATDFSYSSGSGTNTYNDNGSYDNGMGQYAAGAASVTMSYVLGRLRPVVTGGE